MRSLLRQFATAFLEELATSNWLRCNRLALRRTLDGGIWSLSRTSMDLATLVSVVPSYLWILHDLDNCLFARLLVVLDVVTDV